MFVDVMNVRDRGGNDVAGNLINQQSRVSLNASRSTFVGLFASRR